MALPECKDGFIHSEVLLQKGFDVTLFASINSLTASRAKLKSIPLVELILLRNSKHLSKKSLTLSRSKGQNL